MISRVKYYEEHVTPKHNDHMYMKIRFLHIQYSVEEFYFLICKDWAVWHIPRSLVCVLHTGIHITTPCIFATCIYRY